MVIASVLSIAIVPVRLAVAVNSCDSPVAQIVSAQGAVTLDQTPANLDDGICAGVVIEVAANSRAAILLLGQNTILRIDQNTQYVVQSASEESPTIELFRGIIHFFSKVPESLWIKTPFVNAAVEGTEFVVQVDENQSDVLVVEGHVRVSNENGEVLLAANEAASAQKGQAPQRRQVVKPLDAVQWALHYPPLGVSEKTSTPTREAAELLAVGRVEEAHKILDEVKKTTPNDAVAPALLAMIAVGQNRNEAAVALAEEAVAIDPNSSIAYTSLSYAQQSRFDIDAALQSAQRAAENDANNAYAWARLAELQSSKGDLKTSLQSAQKAVEVDPNLSRTQTVLGFAHLTRIEIEDAIIAFNKAIELDSADPLARLGLGLAKIRKNQLAEGREQIEIAASLDPNNSLIRSYLGKAYFEEKRNDLAAVQFDLAKELDPKDPTPYLYDATRKQIGNDPIGSLLDVQNSIERNNNRATYRSRLLLDSDRATRNINLGQVYKDLGFQERGLLEGRKSIIADPGNHSAHRFLADNYTTLSGHKVARVSELLQSQLLQPVNITPVPPQLAESNLLIVEDAGPDVASFNEFGPLFAQNRYNTQPAIVLGSNNTFGDEIVLSGAHNNFAYSLGQFHYETDGFRENNHLKQDIYNIYLQGALSPNLNLQAEVRHRELQHGDIRLNFDNSFDPDFANDLSTESIRLGGHYRSSPKSDWIVSSIYQSEEEGTSQIAGTFNSKIAGHGLISEVQHMFHSSQFNLVSGAGYYRNKQNIDITSSVFGGFNETGVTRHGNAYLYSNFQLLNNLTWTLGVSADQLNSATSGQFDQINPKLGLLWDITSSTTFRAVALRTMKRSLLTDQTIEPTQVAGFNQFFDDGPGGTESRRYGLGVDHEILSNVYGGIEVSERDLVVPIFQLPDDNWEEQLYRAYLNWAFSPNFALQFSYYQERFERLIKDQLSVSFPTTKTQRLPTRLSYFHPNGLFGHLEATYVDQRVSDFVIKEDGADNFLLVDLAIGFRLPKHRGIMTFGINNVFDQDFNFQTPGLRQPKEELAPFLPERTLAAKINFYF